LLLLLEYLSLAIAIAAPGTPFSARVIGMTDGGTAVVTYMTTGRSTYKGKDISGKYGWTDVFMRRGGNWQLVAAHGTAVGRP
jgi:hypothetical protein